MRCHLLALFLLFASLLAAQNSGQPASPKPDESTPSQTAPAKIDPAKEADIRRLMNVAHADILVTQVMARMAESMKPLMTRSLPAGDYREKLIDLFFDKFKAKGSGSQLVDLAVPAYDRHFTDDEIKGLIKFYETPLGQKAITEMPTLMADLQEAGRDWGGHLGKQCMQEVLAEHPELKQAMEEAAVKSKMQ